MVNIIKSSTICPVHRVRYKGENCPYCEKEHKERIKQMYADEIEEYEHSLQITNNDIAKLAEKFTVKIEKK